MPASQLRSLFVHRACASRLAASLALYCLSSGAFLASSAAAEPPPSLNSSLSATVQAAQLGDGISISVVDLKTGQPVYALRERTLRNPASNLKVLTAAAALLELGPDYRFRTGLYGHQQGHRLAGPVYLRGFGDPSLDTGDFLQLAQDLVLRGVTQVERVVIDDSFFDAEVLPPAFEQQPWEPASFRAAVSAVSVNRNAFSFRVQPGTGPKTPALVHLDAPAYFQVENLITTGEGRRLNVIAIQEDGDAQMVLKLRGVIPQGMAGVSYRRRVASPSDYAGHVLVGALKNAGITVENPRPQRGATPANAPLLVQHSSQPLSQILRELGKYSDNFVAEMVLKVLGAERRGVPGTSAHGAEVVHARLAALGIEVPDLTLVNGSGLFDGNLVAPKHITDLLEAMVPHNDCWPEFLSQLSVGGQDGTLHNRLLSLPQGVVVRAKTGTLNDVIALSGYILGKRSDEGFAFSILANGIRGHQSATRTMVDNLIQQLAEHLAKTQR